MESKLTNWFARVTAVACFMVAAAGACSAQEGGGRLAGTWDAVVTIRNCATGDAITSFASIGTFNAGGTFIGSTSGRPQSSRTPEHGVWRHLYGDTYIMKFKSFDFDATGNPISYGVVTHEIQLSQKADTYTSSGIAQFFLMNGTQVGQGCSDAVGTRFEL